VYPPSSPPTPQLAEETDKRPHFVRGGGGGPLAGFHAEKNRNKIHSVPNQIVFDIRLRGIFVNVKKVIKKKGMRRYGKRVAISPFKKGGPRTSNERFIMNKKRKERDRIRETVKIEGGG